MLFWNTVDTVVSILVIPQHPRALLFVFPTYLMLSQPFRDNGSYRIIFYKLVTPISQMFWI